MCRHFAVFLTFAVNYFATHVLRFGGQSRLDGSQFPWKEVQVRMKKKSIRRIEYSNSLKFCSTYWAILLKLGSLYWCQNTYILTTSFSDSQATCLLTSIFVSICRFILFWNVTSGFALDTAKKNRLLQTASFFRASRFFVITLTSLLFSIGFYFDCTTSAKDQPSIAMIKKAHLDISFRGINKQSPFFDSVCHIEYL